MTKIEIMNNQTGEILHMDPDTTIAQIIGKPEFETAAALAEAIKPAIKGVSAEKIADIIAEIIKPETGFFESVAFLKSGEKPKRYRIVLEETGDVATPEEVKAFNESMKSPTPEEARAITEPEATDSAKSDPEPEPQTEPGQDQGTTEAAPESEAPEEEAEPEAKPVDLAEVRKTGGVARSEGKGPDDNPFDGGTDEHLAWAEGWDEADAFIDRIIADGKATALAGKTVSDTPKMQFKEGSTPRKFWEQGFEAGVEEMKGQEAEPTPEGQGRAAFMFGKTLNDNPFEAGLKSHKQWAEGFNAALEEQKA